MSETKDEIENRLMAAVNYRAGWALTDACKELEAAHLMLELARKRAEAAEARVKELDLLLREAIGGAAWESCEYKDYEIAIPTWHCCDWSEWVREVAEKLGIKLPQPPKPEGAK